MLDNLQESGSDGSDFVEDPSAALAPPAEDPAVAIAQALMEQQQKEEDEELFKALAELIKIAWDGERPSREIMVRRYKRINLFWTGNQYMVWDESVGDYRTLDQIPQVLDELEIDPAMYNRPVNFFRAWGESIVGALTTGVPKTHFSPQSASDPDDISTARAFSDISDKIDQDNDPQERLANVVTNIYKHGMTAVYNYVHRDKSYGMSETPVYSSGMFAKTNASCAECGYSEEVEGSEKLIEDGAAQVSNERTELTDLDNAAPTAVLMCPNHGEVPAMMEQGEPYNSAYQSGVQQQPRHRVLTEVYDPLYITIPNNAKNQKDVGFLICDVEIHSAFAKKLYPKIKEKINSGTAGKPEFDSWARAATEYQGDMADYVVTHRRAWFRPWYYEVLKEDWIALLNKRYPQGVRVVAINDDVAEHTDESLDDCWTLSRNPLNNRIYDYSIGMGAVPVQEMLSEMINLIILTIQYGVPETFADPEYFSFEKFNKVRNSAGLVYPAKTPPSGDLGKAFHSLSPAVLPKDAVDFVMRLEQFGQMVTGAFPSIFGGPAQGGSKTYGEYETSKNQALQRLSLVWKMTLVLWNEVKFKSVKMYKDAMLTDESFTKSNGTSDTEVWLKQAEMTGKIGMVVPEGSEQFPVSWTQQREAVFKLIETQLPEFMQLLSLPENATYIKETLGMRNLFVPGSDDRIKQLREISMLIQQPPIPGMNPIEGTPEMQPSVPIDPDVDNHPIELETCLSWLRSDVGQYQKSTNPEGYANVVAHMKAHQMIVAMQEQQQMEKEAAMKNKGEGQGPKVDAPSGE